MLRRCVAVGVGAAWLILTCSSVQAADLRVSFGELTRLLQTIAANAKVYLNNVPGGIVGGLFSSQSYVQITTTQQYPVPIPVRPFRLLGSSYGYFVSDVSSIGLRISPVKGALRLTLTFESEGPEAVAACVEGGCALTDVLPDIQWNNASVDVDFVPIQLRGSLSLEVQRVALRGTPRAVCKATADFVERNACRLGLPFANRTIRQMMGELPNILKGAVNTPSIQTQLAEGLKRYLTIGQAGEVAINSVSVDPRTLTVTFRFNTAGAGN